MSPGMLRRDISRFIIIIIIINEHHHIESDQQIKVTEDKWLWRSVITDMAPRKRLVHHRMILPREFQTCSATDQTLTNYLFAPLPTDLVVGDGGDAAGGRIKTHWESQRGDNLR